MKRLLPWAGIALSGVFAWLAVRHVDFAQVSRAFREASYWPVLPALVALACGTGVRALRWQALFEPARRPTVAAIVRGMLIGLLFNAILPARSGEAARVLALWREEGISRVESLATVIAERVSDVLVLLLLLLVASPFLPPVSWLGAAAVLAGALAAAIVVAVVALVRWRERPLVFVLRPLVGDEPARDGAASLVRGLAVFRHPGAAGRVLALTAASWLLFSCSSWLLLRSLHLDLGFGAALLATIATTLILVIPAAPGGVGQFEAAAIVALSAYGIDRSRALSYGVVLHCVNLIPYVVAGYVALQRHASLVRRRRLHGEEKATTADIVA